MFEKAKIKKIDKEYRKWSEKIEHALAKRPERKGDFVNTSGIPVKRAFTPLDVDGLDYMDDLGMPGEYPFTRGVQTTMYRGRFWTMRQYAGFATAEDTNRRYRFLLEQGQTGL
jgi:methylmalonyl-CoA mutase N-terminal domain/subunit